MAIIQKLCSRCFYLKHGVVALNKTTDYVVNQYLSDLALIASEIELHNRTDRQGSNRVKIERFYILNDLEQSTNILQSGKNYTFVMEYEKNNVDQIFDNVVGSIAITDNKGEIVWLIRSSFANNNFSLKENNASIRAYITDFNLANGIYNTILFISYRDTEILDCISNAGEIQVEGGDYFGTGSIGLPTHCKTLTRSKWLVI